jgi:hypothetical protein
MPTSNSSADPTAGRSTDIGRDPKRTTESSPPGARAALRAAVRQAVRAPSSHNTQPWVFHLRGDDVLELSADRSRALPVLDPDDRELTISCGAALFHVRAVLRAAGFEAEVELCADRAGSDLLARVRVGAAHEPTPADLALAAAIRERRTNRTAYEDRAIAPHVLSLLLGAAREEGAWLGFVDSPATRRALAALVAEADRQQEADPRFRRERATWIRLGRRTSRDGLTASALGVPEPLSRLAPSELAAANLGGLIAARDDARVAGAPTVAVLATRGDTPADWMVAGQALARVLLTACAAGVATSFLNQPIEVPELRARVVEVVRDAADPDAPGAMPSDAVPQIVLRLGYASSVPRTPRRPLDDVLR